MSESRFSRLVRCVPALLCRLSLHISAGAAQAPEKVTLQLKWLHHFPFAGYYAARDKGLYREAGPPILGGCCDKSWR